MRERDLLIDCLRIIEERGREYGEAQSSFGRASNIASAILGRTLTPRDVAMVLLSVKLSRAHYDLLHRDSYMDAINYLAIGFLLSDMGQESTDNVD